MTGIFAAAKAAGALGESPPRAITREGAEKVTGEQPPGVTPLAAVLHVGFGVSMGVLYALTLGRWRRPRPELRGAAFGATVWAVSYAGWVPGLGLMPPPDRDRPDRQIANVVAHLVYGVALGRFTNVIAPRR
jgi:uncharacterized membrane protein YagU involved in acid resistance